MPRGASVNRDRRAEAIPFHGLLESIDAKLRCLRPANARLVVFLLSFAIIVSRRPDVILCPQFWAEDGQLFYAQAYNQGLLHPLFWTYSGYLHTVPRLIAILAQFVPLVYAPLLFNLVAMAIQTLPVLMLVSTRLSIISDKPARLFLALVYLALPNSAELHGNLTNAQWHLGVLAFLVVIADPARTIGSATSDYLATLMSSLTGPFAILLAPMACLVWWKGREPRKLALTLILGAAAFVQGFSILILGPANRMSEKLGANFVLLAKIIANQVFLGVLVGPNSYCHSHGEVAIALALLGTSTLLYGLARGPLALKLFIILAGLLLASALASPTTSRIDNGVLVGPTMPVWQAFELGANIRYWFIPMLAFVVTLVWLLKSSTPAPLQAGARLFLVLILFAVVRSWCFQPYLDLHFAEFARKFQHSTPGTAFQIPLNPPGWSMRLVKH